MACKQPFGISLYCEPVIEINCQPPVPGQIGGAVIGCFAQQLNIVDSDCIIIVVAKLQTGSGGILKAIENGLHHLSMRPGGVFNNHHLRQACCQLSEAHFIAIR